MRLASFLAAAALACACAPALAQKGDIMVGQSAPLSGMMAPTMTGVLEGQQMAIDEANRRGGVNGRKIRLVVMDDGYDPRRALENAKTLVEEKEVTALFGFV